jgi:hypothetical protein
MSRGPSKYKYKEGYMAKKEVTGWVGWVYFAGFLMMLSGVFQIIAGLVALFRDEVFLVGANNLFVLDYTQWGWIHLIFGVVLFLTALSLMSGGLWGRTVGVVLASLSAIANFAFISAYPLWAMLVITLDILIIYALLVHGDEAKA